MSACSRLLALAAAAFAVGASAIGAQPVAAPASPATRSDNYYAAGNTIEIASPISADLIVAGRQIDIKERVAGDILAAGWRVTLAAPADDDVRMAGAEISLNAPVSGDVTIAGGDVTLGSATRVLGRGWVTGQTVRAAGVFERELQIAGATVQISGETRQPLRVIADSLEILPGARIRGGLAYKSPKQARIADAASIAGPVTFDRIPEREAREARQLPTASSVLFALHLLFAGWLVILFLPRAEASVVETLRVRPWRSLLAGFVLVVCTPVAAAILVVSVLGLPIGLVLAASYAIALFIGVLAAAFFLGDAEARLIENGPTTTRGKQMFWLLAGVVTLAVLRAVFGGIVVIGGIVFGVGAIALRAYDAYSHAGVVPHA